MIIAPVSVVITTSPAPILEDDVAATTISVLFCDTITALIPANVTDADVKTDVVYVAKGKLTIAVPAGTSESDVIDAVTASLAEELGVHPKDIEVVSLDLDSGEVIYTVSSPRFEDTAALQTKLNNLDLKSVEDKIRESIPSADVLDNEVDEDIKVEVDVVVDASGAGNVGQASKEIVSALKEDGFTVSTEVAIVTSAPTTSPSFTTLVPTASPSITGIVVTLTLTKSGEVLNDTELESLATQLAQDYGVESGDVNIGATYRVSGSMQLNEVPADISEEALVEILEQNIADSLGLHPKDVDVSVNAATGEVTYTVTVGDSEVAKDAQKALQAVEFMKKLNSGISESLPDTEITSVKTDEDIVMEIVVTIDATEAKNDIDDTNSRVLKELEAAGYESDSKGINQYFERSSFY